MKTIKKPDQLVPVKTWMKMDNPGDWDTIEQARNVAKLPWAFHHVAVMADGHVGKGCSIGSVVAMKDALSPALVGVDIGCGMASIKTNLTASDLPDNLSSLRSDVEAAIPVGFNMHNKSVVGVNKLKLWDEFKDLDSRVQSKLERAMNQMGTLGGGNHFIELCLDSEDNVWIMLHSGSRNVGKTLADIHIGIAKNLTHNTSGLPDKDLAVFLSGTKEMDDYRRDLYWAQRYAFFNRQTMIGLYKTVLAKHFPQVTFGEEVQCHHNYVSEENHFGEDVIITRKGAISANKGQMGIIPGSMATSSFIVKGLGDPESYNSASHGAGRRMSRGKAKKLFNMDDVADQLKGLESRKDAGIIDELPGCYKDVHQVMSDQSNLVEVVAELHAVMCIKG